MRRKKTYSNKETEQVAFHLLTNYSLKHEASGLSAKTLQEYVTKLYKKGSYNHMFEGMTGLQNVIWTEIAPIRWKQRK